MVTFFFSRFNFVLSYRPASKNTKPDALSRLYAPVYQEGPETILPPHCLVATAQLHFPTQEEEVAVPYVQAFVRRCRRVWARTRHHLLQAGKKYKKMADRRRVPAPAYRPGHRVMLSTANLPLKVLSRKFAPRFVGY